MKTPEFLATHGVAFDVDGIITMAGLVVLGGEYAGAVALHDRILYPEQVAAQRDIDGRIVGMQDDAEQARQEVGTLTAAKGVIEQHHKPVPQAMLDVLATNETRIRYDQTQAVTLQHERPSTPVTTAEIFGGVLSLTIAVAVGGMARRVRRTTRQAQAASTADAPQLSAD
jgi:hypothetical protein